MVMHVLTFFTLFCAEARWLREGPNRTSLVAALESLAHRPSIDCPAHGSVSLELMGVPAAELGLLCRTLAACGPAVGKVQLEVSGLQVEPKPFFDALRWCTHISHLR
jgi:hypothetical protein